MHVFRTLLAQNSVESSLPPSKSATSLFVPRAPMLFRAPQAYGGFRKHGELLGSIAVLVTLVYLATQIRIARRTIATSAILGTLET